MSKILAIVGMHRSGTSLLARYLHACGLHMGSDLLGKHASNPAGHFEDREFLMLHNGILTTHQLDYRVSTVVDWNINIATHERAASLITARNKFPQWGWKDPRTCLFLLFWKKLLPDCHFLITYRAYEPSVISLISRDIGMYRDKTSLWQRIRERRFGETEIQQLCNDYLRTWIWYNSEILKYLLEDTTASFSFVPFAQLIKGEFHQVRALSDKGFTLHSPEDFKLRLSKSSQSRHVAIMFDPTLIQQANALDERILHAVTGIGIR